MQVKSAQESLGQAEDALRAIYGAKASIGGPKPARGSLAEVISYAVGEISSCLEQIHHR